MSVLTRGVCTKGRLETTKNLNYIFSSFINRMCRYFLSSFLTSRDYLPFRNNELSSFLRVFSLGSLVGRFTFWLDGGRKVVGWDLEKFSFHKRLCCKCCARTHMPCINQQNKRVTRLSNSAFLLIYKAINPYSMLLDTWSIFIVLHFIWTLVHVTLQTTFVKMRKKFCREILTWKQITAITFGCG